MDDVTRNYNISAWIYAQLSREEREALDEYLDEIKATKTIVE